MSVDASGRRVAPGKNIALVLGAGGARGIAHVGVIQALEARGYRIAGIAGSSMGSLVGGIYAAGRLNEYSEWARGLERGDVLRLLDFAFGYPGLIRGDRVIGALRELVGDHLIEELPIPYTAVACDVEAQREVWLASQLGEEASLAYNGFKPVSIKVGRFDPDFGLEKATSSKWITAMERSGIYEIASWVNDKQDGMGVQVSGVAGNMFYGSAGYFNKDGAEYENEHGKDQPTYNLRAVIAPMAEAGNVLHFGINYANMCCISADPSATR